MSRRTFCRAGVGFLLASTPAPGFAGTSETGSKHYEQKRQSSGREPPTGSEPWRTLPSTPSLPADGETGFVSSEQGRLFFAKFGKGDPIIFLHGGLGNSAYWSYQVQAAAKSYTAIVMDFMGHGRSTMTGSSISYDLLSDNVVDVMDYLHIPRAAFVGWSDGAIVGLLLGMKRAERVEKLFSYGANFNRSGLIPGGSGTGAFALYLRRCPVEYLRLSPEPTRYGDLQRMMARMWAKEPDFGRTDLARIEAPTTISDGEFDEIIRRSHTEELAASINKATLSIQPQVSHFGMLQDPGFMTGKIMEFAAGR